jgi:hypothetical protein
MYSIQPWQLYIYLSEVSFLPVPGSLVLTMGLSE